MPEFPIRSPEDESWDKLDQSKFWSLYLNFQKRIAEESLLTPSKDDSSKIDFKEYSVDLVLVSKDYTKFVENCLEHSFSFLRSYYEIDNKRYISSRDYLEVFIESSESENKDLSNFLRVNPDVVNFFIHHGVFSTKASFDKFLSLEIYNVNLRSNELNLFYKYGLLNNIEDLPFLGSMHCDELAYLLESKIITSIDDFTDIKQKSNTSLITTCVQAGFIKTKDDCLRLNYDLDAFSVELLIKRNFISCLDDVFLIDMSLDEYFFDFFIENKLILNLSCLLKCCESKCFKNLIAANHYEVFSFYFREEIVNDIDDFLKIIEADKFDITKDNYLEIAKSSLEKSMEVSSDKDPFDLHPLLVEFGAMEDFDGDLLSMTNQLDLAFKEQPELSDIENKLDQFYGLIDYFSRNEDGKNIIDILPKISAQKRNSNILAVNRNQALLLEDNFRDQYFNGLKVSKNRTLYLYIRKDRGEMDAFRFMIMAKLAAKYILDEKSLIFNDVKIVPYANGIYPRILYEMGFKVETKSEDDFRNLNVGGNFAYFTHCNTGESKQLYSRNLSCGASYLADIKNTHNLFTPCELIFDVKDASADWSFRSNEESDRLCSNSINLNRMSQVFIKGLQQLESDMLLDLQS